MNADGTRRRNLTLDGGRNPEIYLGNGDWQQMASRDLRQRSGHSRTSRFAGSRPARRSRLHSVHRTRSLASVRLREKQA